LVGDLGQLAAAHGAAHEECHDGIRLRILLCDDWRKSVAWQPINGSRNFFSDVLSGALDVALEHKSTGDISKAFEGINADHFDAGVVPSACSRTTEPSCNSPEMATATRSPGFNPSATSKRRPRSSSVWPAGRICRSETRLPFSRKTLYTPYL